MPRSTTTRSRRIRYGVKRLPVTREPRRALSAEQAERIRAEMARRRDRVLWGLIYRAGLRTEEAVTVRWSDILGISRAGGTMKIDRVFIADTSSTRQRPNAVGCTRDRTARPRLRRLAREIAPGREGVLVCSSSVGTPINLHNWRARIFNPAAHGLGAVGRAVHRAHDVHRLQIHAGLSPVTVAALAGNSPDVIWQHYAREFER